VCPRQGWNPRELNVSWPENLLTFSFRKFPHFLGKYINRLRFRELSDDLKIILKVQVLQQRFSRLGDRSIYYIAGAPTQKKIVLTCTCRSYIIVKYNINKYENCIQVLIGVIPPSGNEKKLFSHSKTYLSKARYSIRYFSSSISTGIKS